MAKNEELYILKGQGVRKVENHYFKPSNRPEVLHSWYSAHVACMKAPHSILKSGVMAHCNLRTWELEARGSKVDGQLEICEILSKTNKAQAMTKTYGVAGTQWPRVGK